MLAWQPIFSDLLSVRSTLWHVSFDLFWGETHLLVVTTSSSMPYDLTLRGWCSIITKSHNLMCLMLFYVLEVMVRECHHPEKEREPLKMTSTLPNQSKYIVHVITLKKRCIQWTATGTLISRMVSVYQYQCVEKNVHIVLYPLYRYKSSMYVCTKINNSRGYCRGVEGLAKSQCTTATQ